MLLCYYPWYRKGTKAAINVCIYNPQFKSTPWYFPLVEQGSHEWGVGNIKSDLQTAGADGIWHSRTNLYKISMNRYQIFKRDSVCHESNCSEKSFTLKIKWNKCIWMDEMASVIVIKSGSKQLFPLFCQLRTWTMHSSDFSRDQKLSLENFSDHFSYY